MSTAPEPGRILPVVVIEDAAHALPLAHAVRAGGISTIEITLRSAAAMGVIRTLALETDLTVGAGTVLDAGQAEAAIAAGATFLISPGYDPGVHAAARTAGVRYVPGVATATEIMRAREAGLSTVKLFPAESVGGVGAIRAYSAVFPGMRFVPTGGIDARLAPAYLSLPAVESVGGSWMVPPSSIRGGDFAEVTRLCREAVELAS